MAEPVKCRACGKPFNAAFSACPFCNAKVTATEPLAASGTGKTRLDYTAMAEQAVKTEQLILLEFHPAALAAVDEFLNHTFGEAGLAAGTPHWKPTPGQEAVVVRFGSFFGEVIRRYFGGYWEEEPSEPVQVLLSSVVIPQGAQVFPINRAFNRMQAGTSDSFFPMFEQLRAHARIAPRPEEADGWLRQADFFIARGRTDLAARFLAQALAIRPDASTEARLQKLLLSAANPTARDSDNDGEIPEELQNAISSGEWILKERGFRTEHGALTLTAVDVVLNSLFGRNPVDAAALQRHPEAPLKLAAFVGDVFVRRYRGRWTAPRGAPLTAWRLTWPSGVTVDPFSIIQRRLEKGGDELVLGQVAEALKPLLANGEAEDPPENPDVWAAQADGLAEDRSRYLWALQFGRIALGYKFQGAAFRVRMAGWAKSLGSLKEAAALLAEAAAIEPKNFAIALEQSTVASMQKNLPAAETFAQRATELAPRYPNGWFALAAVQVAAERYGPAIASYKTAIELAPERAEALRGTLEGLEALKKDADDPLR